LAKDFDPDSTNPTASKADPRAKNKDIRNDEVATISPTEL